MLRHSFRFQQLRFKRLIIGLTLTVRGSTLVVRICQILTTKVDPRTVRLNIFLMAADP